MNSRERILAALNHVQPDKVPLDCSGHRSSGFSIQAYKNLREYLSLPESNLYVHDVIQQLAVPDQDVLELFGFDVIDLGRNFIRDESCWKDWTMHDGTPVKIPKFVDLRESGKDTVMYNSIGRPIAIQKDGCYYFEQTVFPREFDDTDDFSNLEEQFHDVMWFEVGAPPSPLGLEGDDLKTRKKSAKDLRHSTDKAIYGLFGGNFFEGAQMILKMDHALLNLAGEPELMHKFLDKMLEIHKKNVKKFLEACGDEIDVIGFGDDLGMQTGPQISPEMYREFFKPRHAELWGYAKKLKPNIKLCLHSCGGIEPLLRDIIEAGIDAVNPVQISCAGMDLPNLKKEYGRDITFWGGGCDTRDILPTGTPEQIREHVLRNLDIMFKDGGFVFQQVHNILANVPPENIVAMFNAVREYA
jgi:uroporphyrinogen decarboxylase